LGSNEVLSRIAPEAAAAMRSAVIGRAAEQTRPRQMAGPVSPEILARYAGRYRIADRLEMAIEVQEGRIFAQILGPVGKPPRHEIYAESDTKFFWTTMAAQVDFFVDAEGKVSHGVWHQGGQLLAMSRVEEVPTEAAPVA